MKKISLIMLIILMLNSISFVSFGSVSESGSILIGNNSTSVSAKSYTDINTNWTPDESVDYALIDVNYQGYIEYSLNFAVSGRYKVTIQNQLATTDTSGEILLDGVSVRTFSISSSDDKQATDAGYVNVSSGVHTLRFVTAKGIKTKIYLYSLDFEYSGIMTEYNISGDDYTAISGAGTGLVHPNVDGVTIRYLTHRTCLGRSAVTFLPDMVANLTIRKLAVRTRLRCFASGRLPMVITLFSLCYQTSSTSPRCNTSSRLPIVAQRAAIF